MHNMKSYKLQKGLIYQKIGGKKIIFDGEKSILYTLNKSASFIFDSVKKGLNTNEIIDLMIKKYSITKEKAEKDLNNLILDLKKNKIIG